MTSDPHEQESPSPNETTVLSLCQLRKDYGDTTVVDVRELAVPRGEFFGILGPNGAGKTTLVEMLEGLRRPDRGRMNVLGHDPSTRDTELLRRIGVQTQRAAFFTRLTAREHLTTVAALYGVEEPSSVTDTLHTVGILEVTDTRVEKLSGGQRQRLAIASALVHNPEVLFLDEPTALLDPQARRDLWRILADLRRVGTTIIYTTHHLDEAEELCDRVAIMAAGRFVALDTPHRLVDQAQVPTRVSVPVGKITPEQIAEHEAVYRVEVSGGAVVIETWNSADVLTLLNRLCGLDGVQTRTASLEDVYLELLGEGQP